MYYLSLFSVVLITLSFYVPAFFSIGLLLGASTLFLSLTKFKTNTHSLMVLLFFLILLLPSVMYFSSSQYNLSSTAVVTLGIMHGFSLSLNRTRSLSIYNWLPLILIMLIVSIELIQGTIPKEIFPKNGGNYVSINLFGAYLSYFVLSKNFTINGTHVIFTFLIFILCVASQGRSGAALSSLLFILSFYIVFTKTSESLSQTLQVLIKISSIVIISSVLFFSFSYAFIYYQEVGGLEKLLDRGLYNSPREYLISEYLKLMNYESIFFGLNVFDYHQLGEYGFNLHNNYLELHSKFGLPLFIFYLYMVTRILLYLYKRKSFYLILVLLVFLTRAYTDIQTIVGRFDYVLFFLFFFFISQTKGKTRSASM